MWACAQWMSTIGGRTEANAIAGEEIRFKNDKSKVDEVEGMVPPDVQVIAPLFNIVRFVITANPSGVKSLLTLCNRQSDDSEMTLVATGIILATFFKTTFEFHSFVMNTMARVMIPC